MACADGVLDLPLANDFGVHSWDPLCHLGDRRLDSSLQWQDVVAQVMLSFWVPQIGSHPVEIWSGAAFGKDDRRRPQIDGHSCTARINYTEIPLSLGRSIEAGKEETHNAHSCDSVKSGSFCNDQDASSSLCAIILHGLNITKSELQSCVTWSCALLVSWSMT